MALPVGVVRGVWTGTCPGPQNYSAANGAHPTHSGLLWCGAVGTSWQVLSHLFKGARPVGNLGGSKIASNSEMPRFLPGPGNRENLGVRLTPRLDIADSFLLGVPSGQGFCPQEVISIRKYNSLDMMVSGIFSASTKHCMLFHFARWYKLKPKLTSS